jgi:hypothetical protein
MRLSELFNKSQDIKIISSTVDRMTGKVNIEGRDIDLRISEDEPGTGIWEFAFYEKGSTKLTGSGGSLAVFSAVKQFLQGFIEQYQPEQIFFSASSDRQSDFYSKLLKSKLKFTGYKNSENKNAGHFWITKL